MTKLDRHQAMRTNLLTRSGHFDRAAIMKDAHRQRRQMARHGWSWSRCLEFSWSKAKAMRARLNADPDKVERVMVRPTVENIAAMFTAITGRDMTPEELARGAARLASLDR
jgi:hypothetical protein